MVLIEDVRDELRMIKTLRGLTELPIGEVRERLVGGKPIGEYVLFENDHDSVAAVLRQMVREVPLAGGRLRLFELGAHARLGGIETLARNEITSTILENILQAHDDEIERQQDLNDRRG